MKSYYLLAALLLLAPLCSSQDLDSLREFSYQYKGQPFPFDSGMSISDRQYNFIFRQGAFTELGAQMKNAIKVVPKTIYVDVPVRKKGDGNKVIWTILGGVAGAALGIAGVKAFK